MGIKILARTLLQPVLWGAYRLNGIKALDMQMNHPIAGKRAFLKQLRQKRTDIRFLVESGTHLGDTTAFLEPEFEHIYTIELAATYALAARKRFADSKNITVIEGDSAKEIGTILQTISSPCMFWLDGHYSHTDTAKGATETPIVAELKACLTHGSDHLILIDDARLFIGRHDYPTLFGLKKLVREINPAYALYVQHDMIILSNEVAHPIFT